MKLYAPLFAVLLAVPAFAQSEGMMDMEAMEAMSTKMGPSFYSDAGMVTLKPADEIKANFTAMSAGDQEGLRTQCGLLQTDGAQSAKTSAPMKATSEPSPQPTDGAGSAEVSEPMSTTSEPAMEPTDGAMTAEVSMATATNFVADPVRLRALCDVVSGL